MEDSTSTGELDIESIVSKVVEKYIAAGGISKTGRGEIDISREDNEGGQVELETLRAALEEAQTRQRNSSAEMKSLHKTQLEMLKTAVAEERRFRWIQVSLDINTTCIDYDRDHPLHHCLSVYRYIILFFYSFRFFSVRLFERVYVTISTFKTPDRQQL